MTIDFIVHPEHPISTGDKRKSLLEGFYHELDEVIDESEFTVLVNGLYKGDFGDRFPRERTLESASFAFFYCPMPFGEVAPSDWDKFVDLLGEDNRYRVHGTYFGQCTLDFSIQLFAKLYRDEHWHDWLTSPDDQAAKKEEKLTDYHEGNGDFGRVNISYGVVLDPGMMKVRKPHKFRLPFRKNLPHGDMNYQLMDSKTSLYKK